MAANLESFNNTPTDSTSTPSTLISEVNQTREQQSSSGSKMSDYLSAAETKVKDVFGSLQITGDKASDDITGPSLDQARAAADSAKNKEVSGPAAHSTDAASTSLGEGAKAMTAADATKAAGDIEDSLYWYKADDYGRIDRVLKGLKPEEIKQIDENFKKDHDGKGIEETLEKRWKDHPEELATVKELLHPKEAPPAAKPEETPDQIKEKESKALDSIKHDPDVQAKHDEMAKRAKETMKDPELTKFLGNMDKLEEREAKVQQQYEKEYEAKGMSPDQAAKEAEKKAHSEIKDTYTNVEKLLEHNPKAKVNDKDRVELAEQVMKHAADPSTISQGDYGTCAAAVVESRTFTKDPASASKLITEVATTGQYTRPGKEPIVLDKESLKKQGNSTLKESDGKDNKRDFASQLFEVTAINVGLEQRNAMSNPPGHLKYEQHAKNADHITHPEDVGERLIDTATGKTKIEVGLTNDEIAYATKEISPSSAEGATLIDGVALAQLDKKVVDLEFIVHGINGGKPVDTNDPDWARKAHEAVAGKEGLAPKDKESINKEIDELDKQTKLDKQGNILHVGNEQEMKDALAKLKHDGKLPVIVAVDANNEPFWTDGGGGAAGGAGGGHVVTITDYDPKTGVAKMENQWAQNADHDITAKQLFEATRDPKYEIKDLQNEVAQAKAAGHRDYVKEYELLRLEKDQNLITDAEFDKQFTQQTIDRFKDFKAGKMNQDEFVTGTNEGVTMLGMMEHSKKPAEVRRAAAIKAAVAAAVKAA